MELLESNDLKSELLKKSARHRSELEGEVKLISERTGKVLTTALVVGGALAVSYLLIRQLSGSAKKGKTRTRPVKMKVVQADAYAADEPVVYEQEHAMPGIVAQIGTALASQATVFLLGLAKEKLTEYLQAAADKKELKS
jgi:hypothetical protein